MTGLRAGGEPLPHESPRLAERLDLFNLDGLVDGAEGRQRDDALARIDATLDGG